MIMGFVSEFKDFAVRGNMMDMAVGIIIGGAFGKIVSSLVSDMIMPVVGVVSGGVNFAKEKVVLREAVEGGAAEVSLNYGMFVQTTIDFFIVAFVVFMMIKGINSMKKKSEEAQSDSGPVFSPEERLLTEIRDLLKTK